MKHSTIRGCSGKIRHPSKEGACIAASKAKNNRLNVYLCSKCQGWHVGNSNDPLRKINRIDQLLKRDALEQAKRKQLLDKRETQTR